jgi:hypothetical protein
MEAWEEPDCKQYAVFARKRAKSYAAEPGEKWLNVAT